MYSFTTHINLASARLGAQALACSDDFFADKSRLIQDSEAVFIDGKYDQHGKWMDGWESRRRRSCGYDWCVIQLATKGTIEELEIDTSHFTGNFPPAAQVQAATSRQCPAPDSSDWQDITALVALDGDCKCKVASSDTTSEFGWVRLCIYPDGGVARLRVYGQPSLAHATDKRLELSALINGGRVVAVSNAHYGNPEQVLMPGRGANMGDGWETARRRCPGNEWILIKLVRPGLIDSIDIDTAHFKGNFPESISAHAALMPNLSPVAITTQAMFWEQVLPRQQLQADNEHSFTLATPTRANYVKINNYPDGGISRIRIYGTLLSE